MAQLTLRRPGFLSREEKPARQARMGPGGKRLVGLVATLTAILALLLAFAPTILPWNQRYTVKLQSSTFGELDKRSWVEMGGTKIGEVVGVEGNDAIVDIQIDPAYARRLHSDVSASIQPHGLLGPKFVELYPGRTGTYHEGDVIPSSRVHSAVDVDQVVNALQPDVRASLKVVLIELGKASQNRGTDMNGAIHALGQSARNVNTTTATLRAHDEDLSQLLISSEKLDRDLQNAPIAQQIADTDSVLNGLAQVDQNIGDGIDQTATTLRHLDVVMNGNESNLADVLQRLPADLLRLRTLLAAANQLLTGANTIDSQDGYGYSSIQALMTAVIFTKSAFAGQDAYGHFVRIYSTTGPCSTGAPSPPPPGSCAGEPAGSSGGAAPAAAPSSSMSDQQLIQLFLGSS